MPHHLEQSTLVVLAGGEGSRMGRAKGLLAIHGRPILEHILRMVQWPGATMLVTSPGKEHPPGCDGFDLEAVDPMPGMGPLRGVLTALEHARTEQIVVMPLDMPAMGGKPLVWLAEKLAEAPDAMAMMIERRARGEIILEPLPAAFRVTSRNEIEHRCLHGPASLRRLAEDQRVRTARVPASWRENWWMNLNSPGDLSRFEEMVREKQEKEL